MPTGNRSSELIPFQAINRINYRLDYEICDCRNVDRGQLESNPERRKYPNLQYLIFGLGAIFLYLNELFKSASYRLQNEYDGLPTTAIEEVRG